VYVDWSLLLFSSPENADGLSTIDGNGVGFGNPISIQTVAIVKAAKAVRRVYRTESDRPVGIPAAFHLSCLCTDTRHQTWPVCHIIDNTNLYIELLRSILASQNPGYGRNGYYLASSGSVVWDDLYAAMAKTLASRGIIDNDMVETADQETPEKMAGAFGCPPEFVPVQLGGR